MNIFEFAAMLKEATWCEVRAFQSFRERPDEQRTMETILAGHGTEIDVDDFLRREVKPAGLVVAYLNHETEVPRVYEMSEEVSENWRQRGAS